MTRIAVGGFLHETNTFAPTKATYDAFIHGGDWPGMKRGEDVLKAVAIGASAVLVGRPYLFALAADGQAGVGDMIEMFRAEIDRAMALVGVCSLGELDRTFLNLAPRLPVSRPREMGHQTAYLPEPSPVGQPGG